AGFLVGNDAQFEPDLSNNEALVGTTVVPAGPAQADLVVTKNAAPDPFVSRSGELTYTVTVQNNGPDAATGVVVSDQLPEGVTFVSATASNEGLCSSPGAGNTLTCEIGSLGLTENATVTIVVVPDEVTEPTTIVNTASVTGNEIDPNGENDASGVETTIEPPRADLSVTVTASSASPPIDTAVTYTVTISSAGPSDSEDVVLTVDLPPGTELSSVTSATGSCSVGTSSIICTFEALAAGESEIVELVLVMPGTTGILRLDATVSSDTSDPTGTNDTASQEVNVIDTIDLVIRGEGGSGSAVGWPMLVFGGLLLAFSRRRGQSPAVLAAVIGATVLLAPVGVRAEGWYLSAGVGQASAGADAGDLASDLAARGWTIRDVSVDDTDAAWRLGLGFEFTEHFSLEGGYVDLGDATSRYGASVRPTEIDAILTDTFEVHPYLGKGWTLGAAGRFPLGASPVSLVVRGGFFLWEADIEVEVVSGGSGRVDGSENGTDGYYGAGLEFRLQPQVRVTLDWDRYRLDDWVDVPTLGLRLSF
ncbi:MAG: outer membrane beta-barrel protein, partial [Pseudomonadales bacterium]|nr:outer membrane beta-barrel protein [Pseudomonadales bacterium]